MFISPLIIKNILKVRKTLTYLIASMMSHPLPCFFRANSDWLMRSDAWYEFKRLGSDTAAHTYGLHHAVDN